MKTWITNLKIKLLKYLRHTYETQISIPHGRAQFIAAFHSLALTNQQFFVLNPPANDVGNITVTLSNGSPKLTYRFWPKGMEYKDPMPTVEVILDISKAQIRTNTEEWEHVLGLNDPRLAPLKDLFISFAFYQPLTKQMVQSHV